MCVIGGGPASLAAATLLARLGRSVIVVDESPEPGGRLLGQLHRIGRRNDQFHQDGWWHGRRIAAALTADAANAAGVTFLQSRSVWGLYPRWRVCVSGERAQTIDASQVVIATGACENPVPIPGWTLPGVMTISAAQVLATQYRVRPGREGIVVGIDPLSLAISHELKMAGTVVLAIVNLPPHPLISSPHSPVDVITDLARVSHLAPTRVLRMVGRLSVRRWAARLGARLQPDGGLPLWGIPINPRCSVTSILGSRRVEGVDEADLSPAGEILCMRERAVGAAFLAGGLRPLPELAHVAGCRVVSVPDLGGAVPLYGPGLETTESGVFVAGNVTGIESAMVAIAQGQLAAVAIAAPDRVGDYRRQLAHVRMASPISFLPHLRRGRRTIAAIWRSDQIQSPDYAPSPPAAAPNPSIRSPLGDLDDDMLVCRCEEVTVGMVRRVTEDGFISAEEIKRLTRMTMGQCQGRACHPILERIESLYGAALGNAAPVPGSRPPVRPVGLGDLATLATGTVERDRLHGELLPSMSFDDPSGERLGDPRV